MPNNQHPDQSDKSKTPNKPTTPRTDDDKVDEAGKESFPASDPPAWNNGEEEKKHHS